MLKIRSPTYGLVTSFASFLGLLRNKIVKPGSIYSKLHDHDTKKQSDYVVEQSSFSLTALFWLKIVMVETGFMGTRLKRIKSCHIWYLWVLTGYSTESEKICGLEIFQMLRTSPPGKMVSDRC